MRTDDTPTHRTGLGARPPITAATATGTTATTGTSAEAQPTAAELASLDVGNAHQAEAWNGREGRAWAQRARVDAAADAFSPLLTELLDGADLRPTEHVLEVGCGAGEGLVLAARLAPRGSVTGIDLSRPLVERARARVRAHGLTNVELLVDDAQGHPFEPARFDVAISHFG